MKQCFFYLTILSLALFSCSKDKYTISANIRGLENDTIYIELHTFDGDMKTDTVVARNNRFQYNMPTNEVVNVMIKPKKLMKIRPNGSSYWHENRFVQLLLEPGKPLNIKGQIEDDSYISFTVKQQSFSSDYANHRKNLKSQNLINEKINSELEYLMFSPEAAEIPMQTRDSIIKSLFEERDSLNRIIREHQLSYVKNNPNNELSAYYLFRQPIDTFGLYYPHLSESVKRGIFEEILKNQQQRYEKHVLVQQTKESIKEGADAPEFSLPDLSGNLFSLSSLKGKYVVLDFWGSWCGPCLIGFPEMKKYYDKYKSKVEFVGIACNDTDIEWRKAVEKYKLDWIQLKNNESEDVAKNVSVRFAVGNYPTKIILDKGLKIVAVFIGEGKDFYQKLDEILK